MFRALCNFNFGQDYTCQELMTQAEGKARAEELFEREGHQVRLSFGDQSISYVFDGTWKCRGSKFDWWF